MVWCVCMGIIVILAAFYLFRKMGYGLGEHLMLNIAQTVLLLWFSSHFLLKINYHSFLGEISYENRMSYFSTLEIDLDVYSGIYVWMYLSNISSLGYSFDMRSFVENW